MPHHRGVDENKQGTVADENLMGAPFDGRAQKLSPVADQLGFDKPSVELGLMPEFLQQIANFSCFVPAHQSIILPLLT
jgi:hypothetical protein